LVIIYLLIYFHNFFLNRIFFSFFFSDNIHVVRDSFSKLQQLCIQSSIDSEIAARWLQHLDGTGWFDLLNRILCGAKKIADSLSDQENPVPVLVHCSDGWDRTSQLCALSQLIVDAYYRTYSGFQVLIYKEWMRLVDIYFKIFFFFVQTILTKKNSFGHQFAFRTGHNYGGKEDPEQQAPIFLQFLDCVFQLTVQFPTAFEFNERMLRNIHEELLYCRYGTFLYNCERERVKTNLHTSTRSLWDFLDENRAQFVNPFFDSSLTQTLEVQYEIRDLQLWGYYTQYLDAPTSPLDVLISRALALGAKPV
jgi:hypothetical protein